MHVCLIISCFCWQIKIADESLRDISSQIASASSAMLASLDDHPHNQSNASLRSLAGSPLTHSNFVFASSSSTLSSSSAPTPVPSGLVSQQLIEIRSHLRRQHLQTRMAVGLGRMATLLHWHSQRRLATAFFAWHRRSTRAHATEIVVQRAVQLIWMHHVRRAWTRWTAHTLRVIGHRVRGNH